jgi:peptidoglycan hydrolase-like protein with peptidoglycan-binding domain
MIQKLPSNSAAFVTQTQTLNEHNTHTAVQTEEKAQSTNLVQYAKTSETMKGDLALSGVLSKSMIGDHLNAAPAEKVFVPTTTPDIAGPSELKLGSKGKEVETVQIQLNEWRAQNSLPPISTSGEFTEETAEAVRTFQRATFLPATGAMDSFTRPRLIVESDPNFKQLDHQTKLQFTNAYSQLENNPAGRENLLKLVTEPKFAHLISPDAQSAAISGLMASPTKRTLSIVNKLVVDAAILEKNKNFNQLSEETKRETLNTIFSKAANGAIQVGEGENVIKDLVTNPNFAKLTQKQQSQFLEIVRDNPEFMTATYLERMMSDIDQMSPEVRAKAINIVYDNAKEALTQTGDWKRNDQRFDNLIGLLQDPSFIQSTPEEQLAQLGGFSGRTGL